MHVIEVVHRSLQRQEKLVIASKSIHYLNLLIEFLLSVGVCLSINTFYLDGSSSLAERERVKNQFNKTEGFAVLFGTLEVIHLGLNLQSCRRILQLEPSWEWEHSYQLAERCHRIGQKREVYFYLYLYEGLEDVLNVGISKTIVKELLNGTSHFRGQFKKSDLASKLFVKPEKQDPIFEDVAQSNKLSFTTTYKELGVKFCDMEEV